MPRARPPAPPLPPPLCRAAKNAFDNVGGLTAAQIARLVIGDRGAHAGQDWHDALQLRCRGLADDRLVPEVYSELLNHYTANHKNLCLPVVSFDPDGEPKSVMLCFGCGLCHKFAKDNDHYKTKQHY